MNGMTSPRRLWRDLLRDDDGQMTASYVLLIIVGIVIGYMIVRTVATLIGGADIACPDKVECPESGRASIFGNFTKVVQKPSYHNKSL
ncbi:MAG: hypothetical protein HYV63_01700 [Candidatus Schekmanbacteria bacterium]|nr:hypothetical protein [Candidatus Schekmanbacteria bacterium]